MIRTALLGGSFNPIHLGHIGLALAVLRQGLADEVWLMVSPHNPLKPADGLASEQLRLKWAEAAVSDIPGVFASNFEYTLPRPSYTYATLRALRAARPDRAFSLLIGADNWQIFPRWAQHEEILRTTPLLIYPRPGYPVDTDSLPAGVRLISAPRFPYSSTDIRNRLSHGLPTDDMLPPAVRRDILAQGIWKAE